MDKEEETVTLVDMQVYRENLQKRWTLLHVSITRSSRLVTGLTGRGCESS